MSSRPLPDTPDTHSHLHRPPTNIISAHAPHNQVPQKSHTARLTSRPAHQNTPNQKKCPREPISHSSPYPHFSPGVAPRPANLGPPERGVKPKKRTRGGKERSHGRNMPNPKKCIQIHISRSPHPPHFSREVVPNPTSGGDKLSTHRRTPGLEKDEERKQILIHNNRPIVEKSMSKEHQFIKMLRGSLVLKSSVVGR